MRTAFKYLPERAETETRVGEPVKGSPLTLPPFLAVGGSADNKTCGQSQKEQDHPLGGLVLFGANEIEWRETNSGFRTPQRGVETGSNSPVDCCVSENRASQKVAPRWGGFLIYSGTFWCPRACRGAKRRERAEPRSRD